MAMREIDPIGTAIIETEKEIFGEAFGAESTTIDDSGDKTVEEMGEGLEGQHEPPEDEEDDEAEDGESEESEDGEEGEGEANDKDKSEPADKPGKDKTETKVDAEPERTGRVPPGKHREVAERARAAEAERDQLKQQLADKDAVHKRELDAVNAKIDGMLAAFKQSQQPQPKQETAGEKKPDELPDIFDNPNGFVETLDKRLDTKLSTFGDQLTNMRVEFSMGLAHARHGDSFVKAMEALQKLNPQNPDDRATVQRIYASPNAGETLVSWYKRSEALREVGDDPVKYRERIAAEAREALTKDPEFRKQLIESLTAEANAGDAGQPRTVTRLPKSLNGATGGNSTHGGDRFAYDDSDGAVFDSAFR